jgi:hypothetical protein
LVEDEQLLCDNNLKYQANLVSNNLLNCHVNPETTEHDHLICGVSEKLEDIKKDRQIQWSKEKGQTEKQLSTIHYTENQRSSNTNPTENWVCMQVLQMGTKFLIHIRNNANT